MDHGGPSGRRTRSTADGGRRAAAGGSAAGLAPRQPVPEGHAQRPSGRADGPRGAARWPGAAHDPGRRGLAARPRVGAQHQGGDPRRVPARRGGPAERRARPGLRRPPQHVGLPVLLAADGHSRRRPGDPGRQRGRRAHDRRRGRLGAVRRCDQAVALPARGRRARPGQRAADPRCTRRPRHLLPRGRRHRVRRPRQPLPVHGRRHQPVRVRRIRADRRAPPAQPRLRRAALVGEHQRSARQDPAHQSQERRRLQDPRRQPVPRGNAQDPPGDLRDGPAQPVPDRVRPGEGPAVRRRLLTRRR